MSQKQNRMVKWEKSLRITYIKLQDLDIDCNSSMKNWYWNEVEIRQNTWALVLTYHQIEMNSGIIT